MADSNDRSFHEEEDDPSAIEPEQLYELARSELARPAHLRAAPTVLTFAEKILYRVAELAAAESEPLFLECIDRLDEIEADAERRDELGHASELRLLAQRLLDLGLRSQSHVCYVRLLARRSDVVRWHSANSALKALLADPALTLEGYAREIVQRCAEPFDEASDADVVLYDLACVHARAGEIDEALASLARCKRIREQNPSPEDDEDLAALRGDPRFHELLAQERSVHDEPVEGLELSYHASEALAARGLRTIGQLMAQDPSSFPKEIAFELHRALDDIHALEWGLDEARAFEGG